jgi:hypothetical protein
MKMEMILNKGDELKMNSKIKCEIEMYLLDKIKDNKGTRNEELYQKAYDEFCENILEE